MVKGYKGKDKRIHEIHKNLVGRRIVGFGWLTKEESRGLNWSYQPCILELDNGHWIIPMSDDEGNEGGTLKTSFGEGVIWVERPN